MNGAGDGSPPANYYLSKLSAKDREQIGPHLKPVDMPAGTILHYSYSAIERIYFPYSGVLSYVVSDATGDTASTAMIGRNSAAGIAAMFNDGITISEAVVQVRMKAAAVEASAFKQILAENGALHSLCLRHGEALLGQVQQVAACNALHNVDQRLARWLLQGRDLLDDDVLPLTQEMLSQMLGVNRSTVTLAAKRLQEAGLIDHHRGNIVLVDIARLKPVSCGCYAAVNELYLRLVGWSPRADGTRSSS
jgi:CRP-like cAMP-binding protein